MDIPHDSDHELAVVVKPWVLKVESQPRRPAYEKTVASALRIWLEEKGLWDKV